MLNRLQMIDRTVMRSPRDRADMPARGASMEELRFAMVTIIFKRSGPLRALRTLAVALRHSRRVNVD